MQEQFSRTIRLIGDDAFQKLQNATVMVIGLGGVGGHAFDSLLRVGVGHIIAVDGDDISLSNCNRQLLATHVTLGKRKVHAAYERGAEVSPQTEITPVDLFVTRENARELLSTYHPQIVLDCIDTVGAKVALAQAAQDLGIFMVACMSTGNKFNPTRLMVTDITKTHTCPLSRVMRRELKEAGVAHLTVVWSDETPATPVETPVEHGKHIPASLPFVPSSAGILMGKVALDAILKQ
jgi:tRNA A37 threonylcarbamoyladenosine dehydratase